jgi:hypothetical protein
MDHLHVLSAPDENATIAVDNMFTQPVNVPTQYKITSTKRPVVYRKVMFTPPLAALVTAGTNVTLTNAVPYSFTMQPGKSFTVHGLLG